MNSEMITFDICVNQLKEMFPNVDEETIVSALLQNGNSFERTVESLIDFQSDTVKEANAEKEISLFDKIDHNMNDDFNNKKNKYSKSFNQGVRSDINKNESNKNDNKNNIGKNNNTIQRSTSNTNVPNNQNKKTIDEEFRNNDKTISNLTAVEQTTQKKSFGQKFKSFMGNLFSKKKSDSKKLEEYKSIGQNDD